MNILLIGFRYQEIEELQDVLLPEFPQLKIDFALSVRDSCHRLNKSAYDLIFLDATASGTDGPVAHEQVTCDSDNVPIVIIGTNHELARFSNHNGRRPRYLLSKENNYIRKIISILKQEEENRATPQFSPQLPTKEEVKFDRNLLQVLLNGLSDGLLFCNADNKIILLNQAAESILKMSQAKLTGKSIFDLPLGEGTDWLIEVLNGTKTNIRFSSLAFKTQVHNQEVQIRFAPVFTPEKYYLGGFLYLTEIEERLKIDEENQLFLLNDHIFDTLHFTAPKIIAEG